MGLLDRLKRLISNTNDVKSIESMDNRFESIQQRETSISSQQIQSNPAIEEPKPIALSQSSSGYYQESPVNSEIQKDSYELGLAAGYTGRSIKGIESSLARIESQMITKDWFTVKIQEIDRRIEDIERGLGIIKGAIPAMEEQKAAIVKRMPLTQRMEELLEIVKESKEISFADLAIKMNIDISDLRSLLSIMTKRTNMVERYRVHRVGWIKYVGESV